MALPKSKTKESNYQVVETARVLRKKVLDACLKLPRRYTFLLLQDTMHVAKLDWQGNEALAGGLTLGMGTSDEITITPVQLKALLALLQ